MRTVIASLLFIAGVPIFLFGFVFLLKETYRDHGLLWAILLVTCFPGVILVLSLGRSKSFLQSWVFPFPWSFVWLGLLLISCATWIAG
ncbi:MAG TPA: hypothetical protein PKE49_11050 [Leptospiraceae bacterium]|jgi:hypothetical protein|nr:hypothetical protein [Leptospirales bacterium]HMU84640.1 hypothetical protein [Leptospiraceae bacterium]HMW60668.1 hypothetical protein [Leptospiraceae bacterium]HMX57051.1 hypothetical protein [Leptospiraceae bacterium]HMY43957.1 hypothetical protein [Leptospiraceae bacterium]